MKLVIDANVVISALIADSKTRELIVTLDPDLLTPAFVHELSWTGIGLMSVTDVVEEHGWELTVPETDQGVRFEIRAEEQVE